MLQENKPKILCVDDDPKSLRLLEVILAPRGYEVIKAANGKDALKITREKNVNLVLLDIIMPEIDGYTACKEIKADEETRHIPVIVVTSLTSKEEKIMALKAGADDFISKPFDQTELLVRVSTLLTMQEGEEAFAYVIHSLSRAAEVNDDDTGNHILRVGEYCFVLSREMGMPEKFRDAIRLQAPLHDVGKIHTPSAILKKASSLTPEEWDEMKKHTLCGAKIIGGHHRLAMANTIAMTHHEKWDGSGYPHGLEGKDIPIEGRIATIADQYDALRNARSYKPAFDHKKTCEIIIKGDGRTHPAHFDPQVLGAFKKIASSFEGLYEKMKG